MLADYDDYGYNTCNYIHNYLDTCFDYLEDLSEFKLWDAVNDCYFWVEHYVINWHEYILPYVFAVYFFIILNYYVRGSLMCNKYEDDESERKLIITDNWYHFRSDPDYERTTKTE